MQRCRAVRGGDLVGSESPGGWHVARPQQGGEKAQFSWLVGRGTPGGTEPNGPMLVVYELRFWPASATYGHESEPTSLIDDRPRPRNAGGTGC